MSVNKKISYKWKGPYIVIGRPENPNLLEIGFLQEDRSPALETRQFCNVKEAKKYVRRPAWMIIPELEIDDDKPIGEEVTLEKQDYFPPGEIIPAVEIVEKFVESSVNLLDQLKSKPKGVKIAKKTCISKGEYKGWTVVD